MNTTRVLTTKLSSDLAEWLDETSERESVTKRQLLEVALRRMREGRIKTALAESFRRANRDPEMREMAEWGMGDYSYQLKKLGV